MNTYFTAGPQEVKAWTINVGDTAPKAAGKIHGDFEKGFIRARRNYAIKKLESIDNLSVVNGSGAFYLYVENYPFCTIEPNVGVVPVNDFRLEKLAKIVNPKKILPTSMEFVDIAGLVEGASKGEGLGNQFLMNIRETDAIVLLSKTH